MVYYPPSNIIVEDLREALREEWRILKILYIINIEISAWLSAVLEKPSVFISKKNMTIEPPSTADETKKRNS